MGFFSALSKIMAAGAKYEKQKQRQSSLSLMNAKSIANELRIINETLNIINNTPKIPTKVSRILLLDQVANRLKKHSGSEHFHYNSLFPGVVNQFHAFGSSWNSIAKERSDFQQQLETTRRESCCPYCNESIEKGLKCKKCQNTSVKYKDSDKIVHFITKDEHPALKGIEQRLIDLKLDLPFKSCYWCSDTVKLELQHIYDRLQAQEQKAKEIVDKLMGSISITYEIKGDDDKS